MRSVLPDSDAQDSVKKRQARTSEFIVLSMYISNYRYSIRRLYADISFAVANRNFSQRLNRDPPALTS